VRREDSDDSRTKGLPLVQGLSEYSRIRPASARSRNGIIPPHSRTVGVLRILPMLSPIGFEFLRKRGNRRAVAGRRNTRENRGGLDPKPFGIRVSSPQILSLQIEASSVVSFRSKSER
jgi:hypothetical protein